MLRLRAHNLLWYPVKWCAVERLTAGLSSEVFNSGKGRSG